MKRLTSGVAVALTLMLAAAPAAMAQEPATGGTSAGSTTPATGTTTTAPGTSTTPSDGTTTPTTGTTPAPAPATGTTSATKTITLTKAQNKLIQRRVHVKADGALGAKTRTALKKYQAQRKLTKTGRPNLETIKAMKMPFAATVEQKLNATASGTATSTPAAAGDMSTVIAAAQSAIGTPYVSGGNDTSGFDCSGLVVWAFKKAGITLPRTSFDQYEQGTAVQKADIQPGDLVFFSTAGAGASHVGIATSATTVISATTKGVMEHRIDDDYWGAAYVGARRITATASSTTTTSAR